MIGEPAKASQHHVLITRQAMARLQGGPPLALQDGNIPKFDLQSFRRILRGNHNALCNASFQPAVSNCGVLKAM